jgi:uncharacterized membrane protein YcaP (DUF421 family)
MLSFWTGAEELPLWAYLVRAMIMYVYIFVVLKILGQRSIGTLHPLDFLFGIIIGDVIGTPLTQSETPLSGPLAAATFIAGLHLFLSYIALYTPYFRRVIEDEPIILIEHGRILPEQLKKTKITVESLLMDLRLNGAIDLTEVDYAVLESNGQISVIKKSQHQPATVKDVQTAPPPPKGYPKVLIMDGQIIHANVKKVGTVSWLKELLKQRGFSSPKDVFLMTMDEGGKIYTSPMTSKKG